MQGQCNDFADFLVCLGNAIGARPLQSQRSADYQDILNAMVPPSAVMFRTNPITLAPTSGAGSNLDWRYHQWTNDTTLFDGCLRFGGTQTPADIAGPDIDSAYYTGLVLALYGRKAWYDPGWPWRPWNPQTRFVPSISN